MKAEISTHELMMGYDTNDFMYIACRVCDWKYNFPQDKHWYPTAVMVHTAAAIHLKVVYNDMYKAFRKERTTNGLLWC